LNIVFVGLASNYTPGMSYQDNELVRQTLMDGHRVTYISAPTKYVDGVLVDTEPEDTVLPDGLHLIRLPYCKVGPSFIAKKIRKFKGVYEILAQEKPDVIFSHNTQYWPILDVIRYKKDYPEVKLYADTHVAADNSATNWVSLKILHRVFYRRLTKKVLPYLEKYFYITDAEKQFSIENYGVPEELMEFYPLGGELPAAEDAARWRKEHRQELHVAEDELLLVHAGKLEPKKKTDMLLRAFAAVPELKARLAVIGSIPEEQNEALQAQMAADKRVSYLGWKSGAELQEYLCAADLYVQPGKVSAIMQNAVCCDCPVMSYPHEAYCKDYDYQNFIWVRDQEEIEAAFARLATGEIDLSALRRGSERCARELLDYRALAARFYK